MANLPARILGRVPVAVVFCFSTQKGASFAFFTCWWCSQTAEITMFESVETQLDTGLPGLLSACLGLASLGRLCASTQSLYQHFRAGPASGCPLPYTVYFLELQLVTARVTLATKQLLCLHSQCP